LSVEDPGRHAVRRPRWWALAIASVAAVASLGTVFAGLLTVMVARVVVTPPRGRAEAVRILEVDIVAGTVTLARSADSALPGHYGLWFSRDTGHVKMGEIVGSTADTVTRNIVAVDFGELRPGTRGRFSGWFYLTPHDLGHPFESVTLTTTVGLAPAWVIPAAEAESARWAVLVHGRGVKRSETLRAVGVFRGSGYNTLLVSWRNDGDASASEDKRYGLGGTEWLDVEAGIRYAKEERGAVDIVLMGWSMGGATVLQAATMSELAPVVRGIVLESPVVDWAPTLHFQAREMRVPSPVRNAAIVLLGSRRAYRLTGQGAPIDFRTLDFVLRRDELTVPILIMHSEDDGFVPSTASLALANARPDIVTYHSWTTARHAKLWNYDRELFENQISAWLATLDLTGEEDASGHTGCSARRGGAD